MIDVGPDPNSIDRVTERLNQLGAYRSGHLRVLDALVAASNSLVEIIQKTNVPRAVVEEFICLLGADVESIDGNFALRADRRDDYRRRFTLDLLERQYPDCTANGPNLPQPSAALVKKMSTIISAAPRPRRSLDHVPATPETTVRRALWMNDNFELSGATVLCVGDHDLTSISLALLNPETRIVVVDIDEDLLDFITRQAVARGMDIRTIYADLRLGMPEIAQRSADLIFTDPPYTPEGVRLFLTRGLQGLRDRTNGRLLMAYGFGDHQPTLGFKVQKSVQSLSIVYEAIFPKFNKYLGAQAIGSTSDLYVCRPTSATWRAVDRLTEDTINIYTHGVQSLEGVDQEGLDPSASTAVGPALIEAARGAQSLPLSAYVEPGRPTAQPSTVGLGLSAVFDGTAQSSIKNHRSSAVAVNLTDDPGPWLVRILLGLNTRRLAVAVRNNHPDIGDQQSQEALRAVVGDKWTLRIRRSTPDRQHAIIEAEQTPLDQLSAPGTARRIVLDGAHRKLRNVWPDALVKAARRPGVEGITREGARALVADSASPDVLDASLMDLPLGLIRQILRDVTASVDDRVR